MKGIKSESRQGGGGTKKQGGGKGGLVHILDSAEQEHIGEERRESSCIPPIKKKAIWPSVWDTEPLHLSSSLTQYPVTNTHVMVMPLKH